jgi:hypothetical protein
MAMALLGSINNPFSNPIIMNAEMPKFQGTSENFSEFRPKWKEYHRLIKRTHPPPAKETFCTFLSNV